MKELYIVAVPGGVTDPDAADTYSAQEGRQVQIGDTEYRVMDSIENPGWSSDFGGLGTAMRNYPTARYVGVC